MKRHGLRVLGAVGMALAIPLAASASQMSADPAASAPDDEVEHIRALREHAIRNQPDIQRVSLALGAHQNRMLEIGTQLDSMRLELNAVGRASVVLTCPPLPRREEQMRIRERALLEELEEEEARWQELASRLVQLTVP